MVGDTTVFVGEIFAVQLTVSNNGAEWLLLEGLEVSK
jgi:hypothetical protein